MLNLNNVDTMTSEEAFSYLSQGEQEACMYPEDAWYFLQMKVQSGEPIILKGAK